MTHSDLRVAEEVARDFVPVRLSTAEHGGRARELEIRWLPGQVILQPGGRVSSRWLGFLPPEAYRGQLRFARAMSAMDTKDYSLADEIFGGLVEEDGGSGRAGEAGYWWGINEQRRTKDFECGIARWRILLDRHPEDPWTTRVAWMVEAQAAGKGSASEE